MYVHRRFLPKKPLTAKEYFEIGNEFYTQGKLGVAIDRYSRALYLDPNHSDAYFQSGICFYQMSYRPNAMYDARECLERAIEHFNAALKRVPDNATVLVCRGYAHARLRQFEKAMLDFAQAYQLNPDCKIDAEKLATCLQKSKNFSGIPNEILSELIKKLPDDQRLQVSVTDCGMFKPLPRETPSPTNDADKQPESSCVIF